MSTHDENNDCLVSLSGVSHRYEDAVDERALRDINLTVSDGDYLSITGPSGSGKSTLLMIMGSLMQPTSGRVELFGCDLSALQDTRLSVIRSTGIGFLFQSHHLLPEFSAAENVMLQLLTAGCGPPAACRERAIELLQRVGLGQKIDKLPHQMSMGERQRAALCRAVAHAPALLLCDEPTGSLDHDAGARVLDIIEELRADKVQAVVLVTHNPSVATRAESNVHLLDGTVRIRQPRGT